MFTISYQAQYTYWLLIVSALWPLLSICNMALRDDRCCWYHNKSLSVIAEVVVDASILPKNITFPKAGEKKHLKPSRKQNWLSTANDWQFEVNIGKQNLRKKSQRHPLPRHDYLFKRYQTDNNEWVDSFMGKEYWRIAWEEIFKMLPPRIRMSKQRLAILPWADRSWQWTLRWLLTK